FILHKYSYLAKAKSRAYFLVGAEHEDLIQEGMIGLYKAVKDYNPEKTPLFFSFAELCITRQILSAVKSATRQKHQPLNSYVSLNKPIKGEEERTLADILYLYSNRNPEDLVISKETTVDLMGKIHSNLSKLENEVLTLYLKGEDYMHISKLLGKTPKSIDNALQRIKKKISIIADGII
ncbi:MAG: RNA polymerase sporulation sigma factor SigH, partial [Clostridia bacterium]|nr:RNA polymerase sporulation sigma factor SigH [Clostridia bacterium]